MEVRSCGCNRPSHESSASERTHSHHCATGAKRRSTRVVHAVPVVIAWRESATQSLREETTTHSINCHGCRYFSRYRLPKNSRITIQIGTANGDSVPPAKCVPARVAWVRKSRRLDGMYQVGLEFETPQNVWEVEKGPRIGIRFHLRPTRISRRFWAKSNASCNSLKPGLITNCWACSRTPYAQRSSGSSIILRLDSIRTTTWNIRSGPRSF